MAKKIGGDVILQLMSDVAKLKDVQAELTVNMEQATQHLESLTGNMKAMADGSRRQADRLGRVGEMLNVLADRSNDHEERIAALEGRAP
ncbi:MAG: hypothetical protein ACT4TC_13445 [Myxococcaceae bacterium]